MKLDKSYIDRIAAIDKLLVKHNKLFIKNDSILNEHIIKFNEIVKELKSSDINNIEQLKTVNCKLDSILNIKVNGTTGLENVLRLVYESTKTHRASNNVNRAIREWFDCHKTLKLILKSKIVLVIFTAIIVSILQAFGIDINTITNVILGK